MLRPSKVPQGLKPNVDAALNGTAEAVPFQSGFPRHFYPTETGSSANAKGSVAGFSERSCISFAIPRSMA